MRFDRETEVSVSGVSSVQFSLHPENTFPDSGVHNSTGCKAGNPLHTFVSLPHFLGADPSYVDQFQPGDILFIHGRFS